MRLTDKELRDVLSRAEEIQRASRRGDQLNAEFEAVIGAAEAVGLTRPAVERALRERLDLPEAVPEAGDLAFAASADGKFYVAQVLSVADDSARVRFLRGSEHVVTLDQLRPCTLIPGERIVCNWPWWGPWTCTVVAYDAEKQSIKLTDGWGDTKTFPIAEVWLAPRRKGIGASGERPAGVSHAAHGGRCHRRGDRLHAHRIVDAIAATPVNPLRETLPISGRSAP